jgi:ferric-dicitrate binding protein FerR (iron transport regulator)
MRDFDKGNPRLRGLDEWPSRRRARRRKAARAALLVVVVAGIALVFGLAILIAPHIIL